MAYVLSSTPCHCCSHAPQQTLRSALDRYALGTKNECLHLQGLYQDQPPLPFIPGSEVSGIVTEVGAKVKSVKQGDHVCILHMSHDQAPFSPMVTAQSLLHSLSSRGCSQACCRCVP